MLPKDYLKLYKTTRKARQLPFYLLENFKVIRELLGSACAEVLALCISRNFYAQQGAFFAQYRHIPKQILPPSELQHFSSLSSNEQIIAIVQKSPQAKYSEHQGLALMLERIQNPHNLGAILRNAQWFGLRHILCSPDTVDLYNPKTLQASMGAHLGLNIHYQPLLPLLQDLKTQGKAYTLIASTSKAIAAPKAPLNASARSFLIMGNESQGISPALAALATHLVHIPAQNASESLNVAVANGILLQQLVGTQVSLQAIV